jgi:hypothetical protein|tara:strand:+ start:201 stop:623 length:423 start_codon:yes stop_codon:yes gene_type:complete
MIKLEDRISVVILCLVTAMAIFYSLMMLGDGWATAFMERAGRPAPNEDTLYWMGSWGFIYLALAVGNICALLAPASDSRVYFRAMAFLAMVSFLRVLGNTIISDEVVNYVPIIAQLLVLIGYSVILSRTSSRVGTHFGWL